MLYKVLQCVGLNMYRVGVAVCLLCWLGMVCNLGLDAQHAQECFHVGYPCIGHNGIITIVRFSC